MKIAKFTLALVITSFLIFSCSKDDSSETTGNIELANQQNQSEDASVPIANLNTGISIDGATKKTTASPQSNSNINLAVNSTAIEGLLKSGFNISFTSTEADIAGAYLQFKDADGNFSTSYFDIPLASLIQNKKANSKSHITSKKSSLTKKTNIDENKYTIDVNFADSFPPGKFCGVLWIYDTSKNISQPVTVCIEVEAWGGNAAIVGEWVLDSSTGDDDTTTIYCTNNQQIEVPYEKIISETINLKLLENGNFEVTSGGEWKSLDYSASQNSCSAIFENDSDKYEDKTTGQWAYNEVAKKLTLVAFTYVDILDSQYNEDYPNGDLVLEGVSSTIVNGKLVITETYIDNGDTITYSYTFKRK
jgi:hypothetical protein